MKCTKASNEYKLRSLKLESYLAFIELNLFNPDEYSPISHVRPFIFSILSPFYNNVYFINIAKMLEKANFIYSNILYTV
jgi:hypothetical protein